MLKCILWGSGRVFFQNINLIKYYEVTSQMEVLGITSNTIGFDRIAGWKYIEKSNIKRINFDFILIMAEGTSDEIKMEAIGMGITTDKIVSYKVLKLPEFDINKYLGLLDSPPSIFSNNCWGGITYHSLALPFCSPFINMYVKERDYLKFLREPEKYINEKLVLLSEGYNETLNIFFPICACADIKLYFNHYDSFEEANEAWERRKQRINWNNLFVMMYTESQSLAEQFAALPYKRKICFVPFKTELECIYTIDFASMKGVSFAQIVSGMAKGIYPVYNVLDLLCDGKIKELGKD